MFYILLSQYWQGLISGLNIL